MTARLLTPEEMADLHAVSRLRSDAETALAGAQRAAEAQRADLLEKARARALRDAAQSAARIIAQAETVAHRQMDTLEPALARLVSDTVREVIGALDCDAAVIGATRQALTRLRDHRRARILTAPDVADAVKAAIAALDSGPDMAPGTSIDVQVDARLAPGRTILSSDRGHVEIGLSHQIARVTEAWASDAGADGDIAAGRALEDSPA